MGSIESEYEGSYLNFEQAVEDFMMRLADPYVPKVDAVENFGGWYYIFEDMLDSQVEE